MTTVSAGPTRAHPARCALIAALGAVAAALLLTAPVPFPASPVGPGFLAWWDRAGTAAAVFALVRVVGAGLAGWTLAVGSLGLVAAATRAEPDLDLWRRITPGSVRGVIAASAVATAASTPAVATATADSTEADDRPPIVLRDLGPAPGAPQTGPMPLLRDLGPAPVPSASGPGTVVEPQTVDDSIDTEPEPPDTWVVVTGDHLWRIAEETLRDDGLDPTIAEIAAYWHRVIDANRAIVGADPDLIHPGQVLVLPSR